MEMFLKLQNEIEPILSWKLSARRTFTWQKILYAA